MCALKQDQISLAEATSVRQIRVEGRAALIARNTMDDTPKTESDSSKDLIENALFRFTKGMPRRELEMMVQESAECETLLLQDIEILEKALAGTIEISSADIQAILDSPLTPLDRFWSASALMGRLRNDMLVKPPPNSVALEPAAGATRGPKRVDDEGKIQTILQKNAKLYSEDIIPTQTLLALWKKISSSKTALVFKKPVRDEEAPGYSDRIKFPIDLSLIRKRIIANDIQTFASFHEAIGLISHNCVKYNGNYPWIDPIIPKLNSLSQVGIQSTAKWPEISRQWLIATSSNRFRKQPPLGSNHRTLRIF